MPHTLSFAAIALALAAAGLGSPQPARAQVAGSTARSITVTEVQELALGWSAKQSLLGKPVYNAGGDKVGSVVDLIITPDKTLSYLIIGAGGFIGMGRHDVAIAVAQIEDQGGRLVLAGATRDSVKALPPFTYASDTTRQARSTAAADQDIVAAKARLAELDKQASAATAEARAQFETQSAALKKDLQAAEARLADLRKAGAATWRSLEAALAAATARLRQSIAAAKG